MSPFSVANLHSIAGDPEQLSWEPFREGVRLSRVHGDPAAAPAAAFLRYEPGARVPEHRHQGWEYILVLAGVQQDEHGRYPAGTLRVNPPGSVHEVSSPEGCLVLAIWERSVSFTTTATAQVG